MKEKLSLFVFIDAFGWELLQKHPFLDNFLTHKAPVETIFGYSCTCDPTILTGKLPHEHRHFSFFYYNPEESPFGICRLLAWLPKFVTRRGRVRRWLSRLLVRYYGYTGYFQIYNMPFQHLSLFDYSEKRDLYQPGGINSGDPNIFDYLRDKNVPFALSDWRLSEEKNLHSIQEEIKKGNITFGYLYLAAMDAILHRDGTESEDVAKKIRWYEEQLQRIIDLAQQKYEKLHLYIFSDHGMTNIHDSFNLIAEIEKLNLTFGIDYAVVYDSTMARFWFFEESSKEKITQTLSNLDCGHILSQQEMESYGCYFPDHRYGELFFLMSPGVLICPSFMGETVLKGMHGFTPRDKDSTAMIASNVVPPVAINRLDDLYKLMKEEGYEKK